MSKSIDISVLEARISKEERKCEEEQLQLAKLEEEEKALRQRLKEMPKEKARLTSKIGGRKANVKKIKLEAYELLRAQLTRAPSEPGIPPAARSHSRPAKLDDGTKNGSPDAAGPDSPRSPPPVVAPTATSTNVKKRPRAPSPTNSDIVEVPPPIKREASPIRVWAQNWPELHQQPQQPAVEPRINPTPGPSSNRMHSSTPTPIVPGQARNSTGSFFTLGSAFHGASHKRRKSHVPPDVSPHRRDSSSSHRQTERSKEKQKATA